MSANQLMLGLSLGAMALGGCARNLCESEPTDPRCVVSIPPEPLAGTVSPSRLSLTGGGELTIEVKPTPAEGSTLLLRRPSAKDLMLGSATSGKLKVQVKAADLAASSFTPGAAQVVLTQPGQPTLTMPLRLVVEPQFSQPAKVYDATANGDFPIWIAINQANTIYTLNEFPPFAGSTDRQLRLEEYQISNNVLSMRIPQTFGSYKGYPFQTAPAGQAVINGTNVVVLSKNPLPTGSPLAADRCVFSTGQCQSINPMGFGFNVIAGLASDRQSSLFAVQSEVGTLAFRGTDMNPFAEKLAIDSANKPAGGSVVTMASGDVDGDAQSDLVVFQSGPPKVSVFLRQADGKQLRYSDTRSAQLQSLLGAQVPTAAAVVDMDSDGLDDLIILKDGAVALYFNLGSGWTAAATPLPALMGADSLAVGTIDPGAGTGAKAGTKMDIAVASSTGQRIAVLINQASF